MDISRDSADRSAGASDRFARLQRRIAGIAVAVGTGTPIGPVLSMVREAFRDVIGFDRVGVLMYDKRTGLLLDRTGYDEHSQPFDLDGDARRVPDDCRHPVWEVVRGGRSIAHLDDATTTLALPTDHPLYGLRAVVAAALRLGDDLIGVLWADNLRSGRPITEADIELVHMGAQQVAVALLASRVRTMRDRHLETARKLTRLGELIASDSELDEVLRLVRDAVTDVGGLNRAGIYLRDPGSGRYLGVWGTDRKGQPEPLHGIELRVLDDPDDSVAKVIQGKVPYALEENYAERYHLPPDDPMYGVKYHCVLPMRVGDEIVGVLVGDNLLTDTPITEDDIAALMPFADYAAVAVHSSRLQRRLAGRVEQLRHLGRIASAITARTELNEMMRLVRDGIVESGLFDRAGVFLYDAENNLLLGTWGTNDQGQLEDISHNVGAVIPERGMPSDLVVSGKVPYSLLDNRKDLPPELTPPWMANVRWHAVVPMRAGDSIVGCISVDNLLTDRPITDEDVQLLLPFAEQAAAAVQAARMDAELRRRIRNLEALGAVAATVAVQTDLQALMRIVRDAIVESGIFDRAGVWLFDPDTQTIVGTWGTDREGRIENLCDQRVPLDRTRQTPLHKVLRGEVEFSLLADRSVLGEENTPETMQGVRAHAVVPMKAGNTIYGAIAVDNLLTNRPISEDDVRALLPFAEQSAVAVQKTRLVAELEEARRDLERRVEERTAELSRLNAELAAFMYTLSHDLKAPARAAHGFTCAVLEQFGDLLPPEGRRDLERVRAAARRMGSLIESLVALGRLGRSEVQRTNTDPASLVRDVMRELRVEFSHAVDIQVDDLPSCSADAGLLRIVFHNLLKNALQATQEATLARIRVGFEDGAYFVRDNGVGFEQAYADTLFDLFRGYSASQRAERTGFGLAFARRIVEMHGGRIWAEGSPGEGATFRFTIGDGDGALKAAPPSVLTRSSAS